MSVFNYVFSDLAALFLNPHIPTLNFARTRATRGSDLPVEFTLNHADPPHTTAREVNLDSPYLMSDLYAVHLKADALGESTQTGNVLYILHDSHTVRRSCTPVYLPRTADAHVQGIFPRNPLLVEEALCQGNKPIYNYLRQTVWSRSKYVCVDTERGISLCRLDAPILFSCGRHEKLSTHHPIQ